MPQLQIAAVQSLTEKRKTYSEHILITQLKQVLDNIQVPCLICQAQARPLQLLKKWCHSCADYLDQHATEHHQKNIVNIEAHKVRSWDLPIC